MESIRSFEAIEVNGMHIVNFFEKVEGTWFSQRTTHFAPGYPSQTGQTTLEIVRLATDDPRIASLCQTFAAPLERVAFALCIQQAVPTASYGRSASGPSRQTVLVGLLPEAETVGQFFSQTDAEAAVAGQYHLENEVLTLSTQTDEWRTEERLWFMNPNLRMRTSLLKRADGFQMASFCSEIRRLSKS